VSGGTPPYYYFWEFGDLSPYSSEQNPTHTYTSPLVVGGIQDYDAYLIVSDSTSRPETDVTCNVNITVTESTTTPTTTPTETPTETPTTTPTTTNEGITLTDIQGDVAVVRNGVTITTSYLQPGDQVTTGGGSSATITFADGSKVEMGPNSSFELQSMSQTQSVVKLLLGKIHVLLSPIFTVRTPIAVCAVRGAEFVVEVTANGTTTLTVLSDECAFSGTGGLKTVLVGQDQTSVVTPGGVPSDPVSINPSQIDKWWTPQSSLPLEAIFGVVAAVAIVAIVAVVLVLRKHAGAQAPPAVSEEKIEKPTVEQPREANMRGSPTAVSQPPQPPESVPPTASVALSDKKLAFCSNCGKKLPAPNAKFCPFCGTPIKPQP
jgi:PKD repeat protein